MGELKHTRRAAEEVGKVELMDALSCNFVLFEPKTQGFLRFPCSFPKEVQKLGNRLRNGAMLTDMSDKNSHLISFEILSTFKIHLRGVSSAFLTGRIPTFLKESITDRSRPICIIVPSIVLPQWI